MGKIKQGILGGFNGTTGSVVGASWNGIAYMRGKAQSIKNPRTEKQVDVRDNFSRLSKIIGGARAVLISSDWRNTKGGSYFSKAMQFNYDNAVTAEGIDLTKLQFGKFSRAGISNMTATLTLVDGKPTLHIEGTRAVDNKSSFADDVLVVVVCKSEPDEDEDDTVYHTLIELDDGTVIDLDADLSEFIDNWDNQAAYVYIGVAPHNLNLTYGIAPKTNNVSFAVSHVRS